MDYVVKGRVEVINPEDLEIVLAAQSDLKKNVVKKGEVARLVYPPEADAGFKKERFVITYRTNRAKDARSFFHSFTAFLEAQNLTGWAAWHECRHEEINEPCTWNEEYTHEKTGGDL